MPEHFPDNGEAMRHLLNNRPEKDFGGLTFNEMHRLIYETYESDSPLKINSAISEQTLDRLQFFRLTEEFLKILQRDGNIKLTPLGALPKKTLVELYAHRFIVEQLIEEGIYKLTREIDTAVFSALRHNTMLSGLIRKFNGRLCLTKEGSKLLTARDRNKLFQKILLTYTDKLPWSNIDGYAPLPIGNMGWGFSIFMLLREGDTPREARYYASKYLKAFPHFVETYPLSQYSTPERDLIRCYSLRTFERFLEWWGFARRIDESNSWQDGELTKFVATPSLKEVFSFDS